MNQAPTPDKPASTEYKGGLDESSPYTRYQIPAQDKSSPNRINKVGLMNQTPTNVGI